MTNKTPAVINSNTNKLIMVNMTVVETILNMKSKIKTTMTTMMIEFLFLFSTFILFYSFFFFLFHQFFFPSSFTLTSSVFQLFSIFLYVVTAPCLVSQSLAKGVGVVTQVTQPTWLWLSLGSSLASQVRSNTILSATHHNRSHTLTGEGSW